MISELERMGMIVPSEAKQNLSLIKRAMRRSSDTKVVVLLIDGLGTEQLRMAGGTRFATEQADSLVPSLTVPTFASIYSGEHPASHGISGLTQPARDGKRMIDTRISGDFPRNGFFREINNNSGLEAIFPMYMKWYPGWKNGVHGKGIESLESPTYMTLRGIPSLIGKEIQKDHVGCLFVYYPLVDEMLHLFGPASGPARKAVRGTVRAIEATYAQSQKMGFEFYVTSDHGHIGAEKHSTTVVKRNDEILKHAAIWGAPRMRFAASRTGAHIEERLIDRFGKDFAIISSKEALASGIFGHTGANANAKMGFGTHILIPGPHGTMYVEGERLLQHAGEHGGMERDEVKVPFIYCQRS